MAEPLRDRDGREVEALCIHCEREIDPDVCWCGEERRLHGSPMDVGHAFVPMGCDCHRAPEVPYLEPPPMEPHEMPEWRFFDALRAMRGGFTI